MCFKNRRRRDVVYTNNDVCVKFGLKDGKFSFSVI